MREQVSKYSWVLTLLFLAAAALLAARFASTLIARRLWVPAEGPAVVRAAINAPLRGDRLADYRPIQDRNLFNAHPKPAPTARTARASTVETAPAPTPVPLTPLNLTLVGTVVLEGGRSFALIQSGAEVKKVLEGDEVAPGAKLVKVKSDRILVDRGGTHQEILLFPPETTAAAKKPRRGRPTRSRIARPQTTDSDTVRRVGDGKWLIDSREVEKATANMSRLMTQIRVVPNFANGQADGFKVFAIRPGSLFAKIGLQNGDVVKRINGIELEGPEQAFEAYQRLKDETSIQIDLVRRNENQTFSYEIR